MNTIHSPKRQINYKVMRVIVGVVALLLSPTVWFLSDSETGLTSISFSYWTDSRDIFVGSLIAVGFFLSAYNGSGNGRDWEYRLSKLACIFAICVAFFPTSGKSIEHVPAHWVQTIAGLFGLQPCSVHYTAAILLFTCLIAMMWFFSIRAKSKGKPGRANFYRIVSILMVVGIVGLFLLGEILKLDDMLFWIEVWGLSLFGIGWLVAGSYKSGDSIS